MANEKVELTFTGLCVLVITGAEGTEHPTNVEVLMVDARGGDHGRHMPCLSFRGVDLGTIEPITANHRQPIQVAADGQEIVNLAIPPRARILIRWDPKAIDERYTMTWGDSSASMHNAPDLRDFNVTEVYRDGTNTVARVMSLPFGRFETRRIVTTRGGQIKWSFTGSPADARVYANQVTLVSESEQGNDLVVEINGTLYRFLSGDGELPLRISLTNLPSEGRLLEPVIGDGEEPHHLNWYRNIARRLSGSFRLFRRHGAGETRQGTICPTVRSHV